MPDRFDRLVRRRILPTLGFLETVESDQHESFWRVALDRQYLAAASDIAAAERRERTRNFLGILLKGSRVGHVNFRDDVARGRLDLLAKNSRRGNTNRNTNQRSEERR